MRGIQLTGEEIANHIRNAGDTCLLIAPGVDAKVSEALRDRSEGGHKPPAIVAIDGSHHAERSGYGKTSAWRALSETTVLKDLPGTRLGLLVTGRGAWLFAPRAGNLDPRPVVGEKSPDTGEIVPPKEAGLNAVMFDADSREEAQALAWRILGQTGLSPKRDADAGDGHREDWQEEPSPPKQEELVQPISAYEEGEPRATECITKAAIVKAEKAIKEHPPRNYAREQEISVYSAFVGYIELRLVGASLAKEARLKVPEKLVERGLREDEVRKRINENVRIRLDGDEGVDTGVKELNERLNAIRLLYTRQLGEPHGRIYRKRQRQELEDHLDNLKKEIEQVNEFLSEKVEKSVKRNLDNLAESYSKQEPSISRYPSERDSLPVLRKEDMKRLLHDAWREAGATRPSEVKLEVTFKDLTWESLQDGSLRERIVEQFPDLKDSALYQEWQAYEPTA